MHDRYSEAELPRTKKSRWDVGDPRRDPTGVLAKRSEPSASSDTLPPGYESSRGRDERSKDLGSKAKNASFTVM